MADTDPDTRPIAQSTRITISDGTGVVYLQPYLWSDAKMARRTTSLSKGRSKTKEAAPAELPEPATVTAPRRARKAKLRDEKPAEMSVTDAFFPGGDEPVSEVAGPDSMAPGKARRGRKAKSPPAPAPSMTADDRSDEIVAEETTAPSTEPKAAPPVASSSAAQWNAETGTVMFDWPAIEQVAAAGGANQAMAKLLLAARAEGANSRWPF